MTLGIRYMLISIVSFSLMHLCVKAIPEIPVVQTIFIRSVFSIIFCYIAIRQARVPVWGNNKPFLVLRGLVGMFSLICFFYSIQLLPLGTAVTIGNLVPFFTLFLAFLFLKEKIPHLKWLFFGISFLGVFLMKGLDKDLSTVGIILGLCAAFFTATAHFVVRTLRDTDDTAVIMFYFPFITIPCMLPFIFTEWKTPDAREWLFLLLIGITTHVGQLFLTKAYKHEEVKNISYVYYLGIVLSFFYGITFFGEYISLKSSVGVGLVMLGMVLNIIA
ncbi:MAG: DMT family transporter [Cytophaga sp.]|uniref:DMT family transporter n=1 Tax=Cytophaga sp. TaxID=29535 RepID=UPI003F7E10B3